MKMHNRRLVVVLLAAALYCPAGLAAAAAVDTSSDPSFDPQLFPKLAVIVVAEGAERTSVIVKRKGAERSTAILFSDQTRVERAVEDEFVSALMRKGYTLSTRSDLLSILKEQTIQDLSLTEDNSAGIGKVLKVQAVMLVRLTGFQDVQGTGTKAGPATSKASGAIGARLMTVEGAKILWTARYSQQIATTDASKGVQPAVLAAKRIAAAFPKREAEDAGSSTIPPAQKERMVAGALPPTVTNSIGMKLVLIPSGEFYMGSTAEEAGQELKEAEAQNTGSKELDAIRSEVPRHRVTITQPFYVGIYEVTQAEYERVMGSNPSKFTGNPIRPVEQVTWHNAADFCRRLTELPAEKTNGAAYRLLTEAEWEYCCRAGTTTRYSFGDDAADLDRNAWWSHNSGGSTQPVGQLPANGFGLFDMHGNVWEWCADWYADDYYTKSPAEDPKGADSGSSRVIRGNSWFRGRTYIFRAAYRMCGRPDIRDSCGGFRVARNASP